MTFDKFIKQESNEGELQEIYLALKSAFEKFEKSWNTVAPYIKQFGCQKFEEFPTISLQSSVMYGLAEETDFGIYLSAILSYLIELQNLFLEETIDIPDSSVLYDHVLDESFSSENASKMLPAIEMIICSVNCKLDCETSIKDYISQQMDLLILTENADFYENAKYKVPLSQDMEMQIIKVTFFDKQFQNQISACELLTALKRFLVRYLMVDALEYITTNDNLTDYLTNEDFSCWPSVSSLEIAKNLFPSGIQVGQTHSVYKLISSRQTSNQPSVSYNCL
ncbi:21662_t:CDS:2 [Dentiscutata erythropus]|uniref:21662_t:CDS:1 n=1 Tax=Dentiscutata erythropus TaxID=1348616 RepID=A0A9N8ZMB9_9GLOM|nr:21662_t:CDS:2 [Dentiscutata erythropus]